MNRSIGNVIFGSIPPPSKTDKEAETRTVTQTNIDEVVDALANSER